MNTFGHALVILAIAFSMTIAMPSVAQPPARGDDDGAKLLKSIRDRNERDALCRKLMFAYPAQFRAHRDRDSSLSLEELARLTRADMPRILKTDEARLKPIYDEDIPANLTADIASLRIIMTAHFIAGRYREAFAAGEKEPHRHDPESLQLMTDAALALAKNPRDDNELTAVVAWLQRAADALDKRKNPGPWAQEQRTICSLLCKLGRHDEALTTMREVVEVYRKFPGENHPAFARVIGEYFGMLIAAGKPQEAIPLLEETIQIYEKHPKIDRSDVEKLKLLLEFVRKKAGK